MFLVFGSDEWEMHVWAWRIVFLSNLVGSIVTFVFAMSEAMGNLYSLHLLNSMAQLLWWINFAMCLTRSPAFIRESAWAKSGDEFTGDCSRNLRAYTVVVDAIGRCSSEHEAKKYPTLCHTCKVVRPLRAKHCKLLRRCVKRFDHFCPFVGNTLGQDNYKWFIALIYTHMVAGTLWLITALYYVRRVKVSWTLTIFIFYSTLWMLSIFTLANYHTMLLMKNLTTNEHLNAAKYAYLRDEYDDFSNPFDSGNAWANIWDGLFPSHRAYYSREEVIGDSNTATTGDSNEKGSSGNDTAHESVRLL